MTLTGKIIKGTNILRESSIEKNEEGVPFRDSLEEALIGLCRNLDIPVPMWIKKNTTEFARYRRTSFDSDQFIESVKFDRLEIKIII